MVAAAALAVESDRSLLPLLIVAILASWGIAFFVPQLAGYIKDALIPGETIVYEGHISVWHLAPLILLGAVLLPVYGIGLIFWIIAFIRYKTTELAITTKRVVAKFGFISRNTVEINIHKVESIQIHQDVLGRIFNYGSLVIAGAGTPQAPIPGISHPMEFRRAFMEAQDQASQSTMH
jgi:uncharacterized membrane protein YdbT with pleckstrin-like domain